MAREPCEQKPAEHCDFFGQKGSPKDLDRCGLPAAFLLTEGLDQTQPAVLRLSPVDVNGSGLEEQRRRKDASAKCQEARSPLPASLIRPIRDSRAL